MALEICIEILIAVILATVKADVTLQTSPLQTYLNHPGNYFTMQYPPAINDRPIENNFYHSIGPYQQFNNRHANSDYQSFKYSEYNKNLEGIGMKNPAYILSGNHPSYPWPAKLTGTLFQLPSHQLFTQAQQHGPSPYQKIDKQYLPPGYVPLVAKINPPKGYKLTMNGY